MNLAYRPDNPAFLATQIQHESQGVISLSSVERNHRFPGNLMMIASQKQQQFFRNNDVNYIQRSIVRIQLRFFLTRIENFSIDFFSNLDFNKNPAKRQFGRNFPIRSSRLFLSRQHFLTNGHVIGRCYRFFDFLFRINGTLTFTYNDRAADTSPPLISHSNYTSSSHLSSSRASSTIQQPGSRMLIALPLYTREKPWKECFQLLGEGE